MSTAASNIAPLIILALIFGLRYFFDRFLRKRKEKRVHTLQESYDQVLARYNPYYKSLQPEGRERFFKRVLQFIDSKKFEYIDLERQDIMPVLISAAAVQLTYGLDHFQLDFFDTIYIIKDKYTYGPSQTPFEGHVSEDGIYLSWTHFMREFADYSDGQNVGLHEMAHALTYVNFTGHQGRDRNFHDTFVDFSAIARPIFERMQAGETTMLDPYAATNYQEFWAVCVETFFERSQAFKQQLPELYSALCRLLNQDPLSREKFFTIPAA
ncbi:MAG TPA: zinc-dependent peptidase [Puia sp.]|nr:zinc-dependent peptidase [Puia sp.]